MTDGQSSLSQGLGTRADDTISGALELFPDATVLHLGLFRDKVSLQAIESVESSRSRQLRIRVLGEATKLTSNDPA